MAWETALDRLVNRQIHLAERGEARPEDVRAAVLDLHGLAPERAETAFHLGYARALLGLDLPEPPASDRDARRFYAFGRLRGHERRGERNWVADLLTDPVTVMELLADPRIAGQCLPLAMRTLFWSGDLHLAVQAIDYLSTAATDSAESATLVDAAMADLLTRLERRLDPDEAESTLSVLHKCVGLTCFASLPPVVQAGYRYELGRRLLAISEFDEARLLFEQALDGADDARLLRGRCALGGALATLRIHEAIDLGPVAARGNRDAVRGWLARAGDSDETWAPESLFVAGLLAYETGDHGQAYARLDHATKRLRRVSGRDQPLAARTSFFLAASILAGGLVDESARALRLLEETLDIVRPDLESFYSVHEALKGKDRRLALRFLDAVDVGRGSAPDQLLFIALEYLGLGEAQPAEAAAERVLEIAVDLDQRIEALRVLLTAHNMRGARQSARAVFQDIRELLMQRGKFTELEKLLLNEDFVGQALDHLEIRCELVALYEEMDERDFEKAQLQTSIARTLRARKDSDSLREAAGLLREVEISFPDLVADDLLAVGKLLDLADADEVDAEDGRARCAAAREQLGRAPRVLVVGGNERQRRHHPKFEELAAGWGFEGEWLMANYRSPQKLVQTIGERIQHRDVDVLVLLHWNRHETTEPASELARRAGVPHRVLHYAGFTSLQMCLTEILGRPLADALDEVPAGGKDRRRGRIRA
jgi:tetratricopeptide (TPR) repeat protein